MPELPEVESVRRQLEPELAGRVVDRVWFDDHPAHRFHAVGDVVGHELVRVDRRGKYLLVPLAPTPAAVARTDGRAVLVLHLGMTGSFRIVAADDPRDDHLRTAWWLDDGRRLDFRDPRRFGRVSVVDPDEIADVVPTLAALGPEPLGDDFTVAGFAAGLQATTAPVKAALLGQRLVAGVGNIYADEALWRARVSPHSRRVGPARAARLHAAVRDVLAEAIDREGTTFRDYQMVNGQSGRNAPFLQAYGQAGLPCQRCGRELSHAVVAQRGTTWCRTCQR